MTSVKFSIEAGFPLGDLLHHKIHVRAPSYLDAGVAEDGRKGVATDGETRRKILDFLHGDIEQGLSQYRCSKHAEGVSKVTISGTELDAVWKILDAVDDGKERSE